MTLNTVEYNLQFESVTYTIMDISSLLEENQFLIAIGYPAGFYTPSSLNSAILFYTFNTITSEFTVYSELILNSNSLINFKIAQLHLTTYVIILNEGSLLAYELDHL